MLCLACEVKSQKAIDISFVKSMVSSLQSAVQLLGHPFADFIIKLSSTFTEGIALQDAINKYAQLGQDAASRVSRDRNNLNLATVGRQLQSYKKSVDAACLEHEKCKAQVSHDTPPTSTKVLDFEPGSTFQGLGTDVIAGALAAACKVFATNIAETNNALKAASKGYEARGPQDWKADLKDPMDLDEVVEKAKATVVTMEGRVLGEKIGTLEEVGNVFSHFCFFSCTRVWSSLVSLVTSY